MVRIITKLLLTLAVGFSSQSLSAFSLLGAYAAYQDQNIGYRWGREVNNFGGVMNLGEEYRWNHPNVYYAFDESFLNYFGQKGVQEVEAAIKILNDVPAASEIDINQFPLYSQRINFRAQALRLVDIKSVTLNTLLEELGLTDPTRYVFTLRTRFTPPNGTNYFVIKRNFDPDTLQPSSYINGQLWTYLTIFDNQDAPIAYPVNRPVDPLVFAEPVSTGFGWTFGRFTFGSFYTGLTRDDVAGLRYIYHPNNANVEDLIPSATSSLFPNANAANPGTTPLPALVSGGSAWGFPPASSVAISPIGGGAQPWAALIFSTNGLTNGIGGGINTNNTPQGTNTTAGLRPGVNKITFKRVNYDSLLGQVLDPALDVFPDSILLNNGKRAGSATRLISQPDILFTAADLTGLAPGSGAGVNSYFMVLRGGGLVNNNQLNGNERLDGPGVVRGPIAITFNSVGPFFFNSQPSFLGEGSFSASFIWGAFDATTNAPVVFPIGTSIQEIERQATGGR